MIRKKIKWKNVFISIIALVLLVILIISVINIIKWSIDNKKTDTQVDKIQEVVKIEEVSDTEKTEIIEQTGEIPKTDPYWDYIMMNLIDVNFSELKKLNSDVKGWIQVNGTNINYPFVQTADNKYYLTHSFDKSYNNAGWVFMDYRNNINNLGKNNIIYAHGRLDTTMFGSLKNILASGWLNHKNNYVVKLSTENENTLWQVISVYKIPTTSDYIQTEFNDDTEYQNFLDLITSRSAFNFNSSVNTTDKIITLSTCFDDNDKVVMHAKLIKSEKR